MRRAESLNIFDPPLAGDTVVFPDGEKFTVAQDGYGWTLYYMNTFKTKKDFPVVGFDMVGFYRAIFDSLRLDYD